jgi:hypothetical protein
VAAAAGDVKKRNTGKRNRKNNLGRRSDMQPPSAENNKKKETLHPGSEQAFRNNLQKRVTVPCEYLLNFINKCEDKYF